MFTVKLLKHDTSGCATVKSSSFSCPHYEVYYEGSRAVVVVHSKTGDEGIEHIIHTSKTEPFTYNHAFDMAYVENEAGKTIDRIGPFTRPSMEADEMVGIEPGGGHDSLKQAQEMQVEKQIRMRVERGLN